MNKNEYELEQLCKQLLEIKPLEANSPQVKAAANAAFHALGKILVDDILARQMEEFAKRTLIY